MRKNMKKKKKKKSGWSRGRWPGIAAKWQRARANNSEHLPLYLLLYSLCSLERRTTDLQCQFLISYLFGFFPSPLSPLPMPRLLLFHRCYICIICIAARSAPFFRATKGAQHPPPHHVHQPNFHRCVHIPVSAFFFVALFLLWIFPQLILILIVIILYIWKNSFMHPRDPKSTIIQPWIIFFPR